MSLFSTLGGRAEAEAEAEAGVIQRFFFVGFPVFEGVHLWGKNVFGKNIAL
jgi:hypothetical protein